MKRCNIVHCSQEVFGFDFGYIEFRFFLTGLVGFFRIIQGCCAGCMFVKAKA